MGQFPSSTSVNRRSLLRGALATVGVAGVSAALSGCTAKGGGSSTSSSKTVTVMYASTEFTKAHIAEFEKLNPGVTIEFIEWDQTRYNAMVAAGNPPDVVRGQAEGNLVARGLLTPLDQYLDTSTVIKKADLPPINNGGRWDGLKQGTGKYYALVKDWSPDACLWQNATLFEKAGVSPLSTTERISWDDLLATGKKLTIKSAGKTVQHGLGMEWAWGVLAPMFLMIAQQGGTVFNSDLTQVDFTGPAAQRAVQWFTDFGKAGVGPTSLNPLPDNADLSTFTAGKMALSMDGYWFGANFEQGPAELQKAVSMAPGPTFGKPLNTSFSGGTAIYIPAKAKNKDLAWKVIEYFIGGPPAVERAKSGWGLPSLQSLWQYLPEQHEYQKNAIATAKIETQNLITLPSSPYVTTAQWFDVLDKQLQATIRGKASVADACGRIQDTINKALKQGKAQIG